MSYECNKFTQGTVLSPSFSTAMPTWHGGSALPPCLASEKKLPAASLLRFFLSSALLSGFFFLERARFPFDLPFRTRGCTFETVSHVRTWRWTWTMAMPLVMAKRTSHGRRRRGRGCVAWP